jgi:hypothetical protein
VTEAVAGQLEFRLGLDVISSYKRLDYTAWHALAEFVDNSTQSFTDHREELEEAYKREAEDQLTVSIVYDNNAGTVRVSDNALGMNRAELDNALEVGRAPANTAGRSKFGMGMKTAACWFGNRWTIRTKKLGETTELTVEIDVSQVAAGDRQLPTTEKPDQDPDEHYTVIEIGELNRPLKGRTHSKIRDFLSSIYRQDLKIGTLDLQWQAEHLDWTFSDDEFLTAKDGQPYKRNFSFEVEGKSAVGWIGVLDRGSRAKAGFSILHADRVVKGWPGSWRPRSIFGQYEGSNDLINQRIVGEIALDDFQVTHTKDGILWFGDEEDLVEAALKEEAAEFVAVAKHRRKRGDASGGPSDQEVSIAVEEFQAELSSAELEDFVTVEDVPPPEAVAANMQPVLEAIVGEDPDFSATVGELAIRGYLERDTSANDPYVVVDPASAEGLTVVVNMAHPHVNELTGAEGMLNYLRHCVYDAIAEWKASQGAAAIDSNTVKMLKDRLLRLPAEIEMHDPQVG